MSHNITLKGVSFKDTALLGNIVKSMSEGRATLDLGAKTFRTYAGQPNKCDAAIKMAGKHDIGLIRQPDGGYQPLFDPYDMDPMFKADKGQSYIGKLQREYALQEAEYEAAQNNFSTTRVEQPNGVITLELVSNG